MIDAMPMTLGATDGERHDFATLGNRFMIKTEDTDGRFALLEHTIPPRGLAAPLHIHKNEDEYSFVLTGRMGALLGDDVVEAGPGELVFKPRGQWHAFWNASDEECRVLELISPGEFSNYFAELAPYLGNPRPDGPPDFEALARIQAKYGLTMDMESVGMLVERFGLRM